jgi:hypothetical protein
MLENSSKFVGVALNWMVTPILRLEYLQPRSSCLPDPARRRREANLVEKVHG